MKFSSSRIAAASLALLFAAAFAALASPAVASSCRVAADGAQTCEYDGGTAPSPVGTGDGGASPNPGASTPAPGSSEPGPAVPAVDPPVSAPGEATPAGPSSPAAPNVPSAPRPEAPFAPQAPARASESPAGAGAAPQPSAATGSPTDMSSPTPSPTMQRIVGAAPSSDDAGRAQGANAGGEVSTPSPMGSRDRDPAGAESPARVADAADVTRVANAETAPLFAAIAIGGSIAVATVRSLGRPTPDGPPD
ncbi:hypothetical protein SPF06_20220 [Sinomonas sp. JGH33]|uniref:Uncharacterized protein n=1 Tax=Sinomonas terricola TaxID=3110330 RepID=A0ABU5TBI9_9MICC|nr:hypothetical protein [Sinomonas sp. JGH33]MEA5457057.1 hypothetical protein [Sinomonas sp. JGH33]